jgi:hypothetical protein
MMFDIHKQAGFTILELTIASALTVIVAAITVTLIYRVFTDNQNVSDELVSGYQLDRASYWITHDAQMADTVNVQPATGLLEVEWTDWGLNTNSVSHSVVYAIADVSNNMGVLIRHFHDSNGTDQVTQVAEAIYYNPGDPECSQVSYQNGLLTLQLTSRLGSGRYTRTYVIYPRPK